MPKKNKNWYWESNFFYPWLGLVVFGGPVIAQLPWIAIILILLLSTVLICTWTWTDVIDKDGIHKKRFLGKDKHIPFHELKVVVTNGYKSINNNGDISNRVVFLSKREKIVFYQFYDNKNFSIRSKVNLLKRIKNHAKESRVIIVIRKRNELNIFGANHPFKNVKINECIRRYHW